MFYSQFILAKKGPLGTIWIAAHLERKLRKNQVADTDIGVSVDSILFPDIPIALRLSSHLLLGVVRIYSRKVNYLFHDCSEALLKIKQAFRSTAVDLPPEESTAPYHSITLPETFDLEDFELPDSTFLNGNFVDHHVSTREQITLQDTMEATGYSTSQFGLDERFGDGEASQIGLDLDEMLLDKESLPHHTLPLLGSGENAEHQIAGQPETPFTNMDIDDGQHDDNDDRNVESPKDITEPFAVDLGSSAVPDDLFMPCPANGVQSSDLSEHAQAPSTPGLMEEAIPANFQEIPALSPPGKTSPSNDVEAIIPEVSYNSHMETECIDSVNENGTIPAVSMDPEFSEIATAPQSLDEILAGGFEELPGRSQKSAEILQNETEQYSDLHKDKSESHAPSSQDPAGNVDSCLNTNASALNSDCSLRACSLQLNQTNVRSQEGGSAELLLKEAGLGTSEVLEKEVLHAGGSSVEVQGEDIHLAHDLDHLIVQQNLHSKNKVDGDKSDELLTDAVAKDSQLEILNCSASSEYPEPERMLLASAGDTEFANDLGQCTAEKGVTESDGSVDIIKSCLGKKRHLTESIPLPQNGSSAKLAVAPQSGRNSDCIPGDDDLLASILVGRRSSALNIKPTPSLPTLASSKRPRLSAKVGLPKRKVLLDDTLVLHADAIRQQLINTEDIRRIRKKAPCTRPEIWMIQKCLLEDDIFSESVLAGMSTELVVLHSRQTYDLNEALASQVDANSSHLGVSESKVEETYIPNAVILNKNDGGRQELSVETQPPSLDAQGQLDTLPQSPDAPQLNFSSNGQPCSAISMELETRDSRDGVVKYIVDAGIPHSGNGCDISADSRTDISSINKHNEKEAPSKLNDELSMHEEQKSLQELVQPYDELGDMNDKTLCLTTNFEATSLKDGNLVCAEDAILNNPQGCDANACDNVNDEAPISVVDNCSISDVAMVNTEPINMATGMGNLTGEQFRKEDHEVGVDGEVVAERMKDDEENLTSEITCAEVSNAASSGALHLNADVENVPSNVGEHSGHQQSHPESAVDVESTHFSSAAPRDANDFCSAIDGNDTEFLNVDDEEDFAEEADDDVPNPEAAQSHENSGWSSRTRGVARYLKSLFDDESGHGRKIVAMERLLVGKTRKEASRMFFESLVLKSKDYIHVEQGNSFENINIRPRAKLLKSEF